jgi:hypothetical protein
LIASEMDRESMSSNRAAKLGNYGSPELDPSRQVDLLMEELEIVLRCRCCAPTSAPFKIEAWDSDLASAQDWLQGGRARNGSNVS